MEISMTSSSMSTSSTLCLKDKIHNYIWSISWNAFLLNTITEEIENEVFYQSKLLIFLHFPIRKKNYFYWASKLLQHLVGNE